MKIVNGRDPQTRLLDRQCPCGVPAAVSWPTCKAHPASSARYAADLLLVLRTGLGDREGVFRRMWLRARWVAWTLRRSR